MEIQGQVIKQLDTINTSIGGLALISGSVVNLSSSMAVNFTNIESYTSQSAVSLKSIDTRISQSNVLLLGILNK